MARGLFSKIITFGLATTLGNVLNAMPVEDSTLAGILPLPKTPSEKIPQRIKKWREQHKDQCVPLVGEVAPKNKTKKSIADVLTRLKKSQYYSSMVRVLSNRDIIVCDASVLPNDMGNDAAKYQVNNRAIILDSSREISQRMNDVSHETRHAYQDAVIPDFMSPRENNVQNLADLYSFEADAEAFSKVVAWELKTKGDPVAWQAAKKETIYMPIAAAIEKSLQNVGDQPTVNDYNLSLKRGFEGWVGSRDLRLQYFREGWDLNQACIFPSGPDALSGRILNMPGVDGKKPYITSADIEKVQKIAISDAGALAQVAEQTEGLSPAKKQKFRNSLTCR